MRMLMIHGAVCIAFAVLFVWSRGAFAAAAARINRQLLAPLDLSDETVRTALLIIFAANILGACAIGSEWSSSTVRSGYLIREEYGNGGRGFSAPRLRLRRSPGHCPWGDARLPCGQGSSAGQQSGR